MGRSGTTLLQQLISNTHNLDNLGEFITFDDTRQSSIDSLVKLDNWVVKFFVECNDRSVDSYIQDINTLRPTIIINSYREDKFDQYLSFQISLNNNKWNANTKLEYTSFTIDNIEQTVKYFFDSLKLNEEILLKLGEKYEIKNVSYEDILSNRSPADLKIKFDQSRVTLVKQNTLDEKISLIENIEDVKMYWDNAVK
jgi:hypothetical protein